MQAKSVGGGIPDALTKDLNFATYKAVAMACDNGATLPSSPAPVIGQWFLHTPTGRKVLMQYDGSNWVPIFNFGTMTIYVDKTDGTDNQNIGTGVDAAAFKTIQFAINQIPGLNAGNIIVNINAETYAEAVIVQGKMFSGAFSLTINGTLVSQEVVTSAVPVVGYLNQRGTVTKAGIFAGNAYSNMLAYFATDAVYRVIDGHATTLPYTGGKTLAPATGDILKGNTSGAYCTVISCSITGGSFAGNNAAGNLVVLVEYGTFSNAETFTNVTTSNANNATCGTPAANTDTIVTVGSAPSTTSQDVTIYNWGTTITSISIAAAQTGIILNSIKQTSYATIGLNSYTTMNECAVVRGAAVALYMPDKSVIWTWNCFFSATQQAIVLYGGTFVCNRGKILNVNNTYCLFDGYSYASIDNSVIDGTTVQAANVGMIVSRLGYGVTFSSSYGSCNNIIRNVKTGVNADNNSIVEYIGATTFINVTTPSAYATGGQIS